MRSFIIIAFLAGLASCSNGDRNPNPPVPYNPPQISSEELKELMQEGCAVATDEEELRICTCVFTDNEVCPPPKIPYYSPR